MDIHGLLCDQGWEGKRSDGWMPACPAHRLLHASLMAEDGNLGQSNGPITRIFFFWIQNWDMHQFMDVRGWLCQISASLTS